MVSSQELVNYIVLCLNALELASQAEVAYLYRAVLQDEQVSWFYVSVHHAGRVNELETAEQII